MCPPRLQNDSGDELSPVSYALPDLGSGQRTSVCSTGSEDTSSSSPFTRQLSGSKSEDSFWESWQNNQRTLAWKKPPKSLKYASAHVGRQKMKSLFVLWCCRWWQTESGQWLQPEGQRETGGELLQWTFLWARAGPHRLHSEPLRCGVAQTSSRSQLVVVEGGYVFLTGCAWFDGTSCSGVLSNLSYRDLVNPVKRNIIAQQGRI